MNEKPYIKYLIENFKTNSDISPILDQYFLSNIGFDEVVEKIEVIENKSVMTYTTWLKSKKIDNLLK